MLKMYFMDNPFDKKQQDKRELNKKSFQVNDNEIEGVIGREDVIENQGSEEQVMKEKYLSEVSKIEDAPGDGGIDKEESI